ncbi:tumor necrosis factor receptor superfamily member 14-like isoform X2 [Centropristis striata]|nr:tumor necrosis factor receptor superfamily member 14-like isoform X2 [Centropristis striata]XP_059188991.1 tumor necrosis factor receptor superfamily member 14-like isoform X2 [Centropristis striata]
MARALCCGPNEYKTRDGECCPMCAEGTVVRRDCTALSGTRCRACGESEPTYMNEPNGLDKCFSCSSCAQGQGLFAKQQCTATTNTVCDVINGYFCEVVKDDAGCSLAKKHATCLAGEMIQTPGTNRKDTVCAPCQPGYFSQHGVNCTAWTICSETQSKVQEGSTSSDVVCGSASRSHYIICIPALVSSLTVVGLLIRGKIK